MDISHERWDFVELNSLTCSSTQGLGLNVLAELV